MDEDHQVINSLIELLPKHFSSEFIMIEVSAAIRNYVKNEKMIRHIYPRNMGLLINAGLDTQFSKPKLSLISTIKVCSIDPEYMKYIEELGASKLISE